MHLRKPLKWLTWNERKTFSVVVNRLVYDHWLYLGASWHFKLRNPSRDEVTYTCIAFGLSVKLVVVNIFLALRSGVNLSFCYFLAEFCFVRSSKRHRCRSYAVNRGHFLCFFNVLYCRCCHQRWIVLWAKEAFRTCWHDDGGRILTTEAMRRPFFQKFLYYVVPIIFEAIWSRGATVRQRCVSRVQLMESKFKRLDDGLLNKAPPNTHLSIEDCQLYRSAKRSTVRESLFYSMFYYV